MKQGQLVNRIVMLLLFGAIVAYFIGAAWRGLREPYPTVRAYSYTVENSLETTGYLARKEETVAGAGGIVRLIPAEGEKVAAGSVVARLYDNQLSLERSDRLSQLEEEAARLTAALSSRETGQTDSDRQAITALTTLHVSVEKGDFTRLEDRVTAFKSAIYQLAKSHGETGDPQSALLSVQTQIDQLRTQTAQSTGYVAVSKSGVFSGRTDGYEALLTPDSLKTLTPSALDALEHQPHPVAADTLGKLITDATWYFVCPVPEETASRMGEGTYVTVRFSRDWSGTVDMLVEQVGTPENGRVAVVLSADRYLSHVTLLRRQTVDLVFSTSEGIRVPTRAVRVEDVTKTDPETQQVTVVGQQTGVYVRVGVKAEFKPVNVLAQGQDYYIVTPVLPQNPSKTVEKKALRPGDYVIVGGEPVWDGKVLQ